MRGYGDTTSGWWYLLGGIVIGLAAGMLVRPGVEEAGEGEEGLGARLLKRIPRRVKVAGGVGAVKGAGGEAYHEAKEKFTGER